MSPATSKEACKGCVDFTLNCKMEKFNKSGKCPCTECLVKSMCNIACDCYFNWRTRIDEAACRHYFNRKDNNE